MKLATTNPFAGLEEILTENEPLAPHTWYKIGGPARWYLQPRTVEELQEASRRCVENDIPIYVLGLGANLLVGDDGVNGAVFRLDADYWRRVKYEGNTVEVGAGADMQKLILRTVRQGLAGIECLAGIPGTVGGGVVKLLDANRDLIARRAGRPIEIFAVSARDRTRDRGIDLSRFAWVDDSSSLATLADVDVVVELVGGSDGPALTLARATLAAGLPVSFTASLGGMFSL